MNYSEKLRPYLAGELPLEEANALEEALANNPELAFEWQLLQLEERDLPAWINQDPGLDLHSWRPALEALRQTRTPLWFLSLLAGTIVIAGTGGRKKPVKAPPRRQEKGEHRTDE